MPRYPHLLTNPFDTSLIGAKLRALRTVGVPYSDGETETAVTAMRNQANGIAKDVESQQGPTGLADKEIMALTAYLQRLGTDIKWKRPETQAPCSATALPPQAPAAAPRPGRTDSRRRRQQRGTRRAGSEDAARARRPTRPKPPLRAAGR
jgi:hypothetical protein